jgi:ligand-binding sensor domain-containing protein/two-component sensor histidine kinase
MKKNLFLIITLSFVIIVAFAQDHQLYFEKITTENGLSHNKVNCIIKDTRGFIWLGTDDGLNRYDGNKFTIYRNEPADNNTISGNIITDLLEDNKGIIWIATADGGITKYNYRLPPQQQFKQYKNLPGNANSIPSNVINKMLEDRYGYLWLATSGQYLLRFNKQTQKFEQPIKSGIRTFLSLSLASGDTLWAGRQGGGMLTINIKTLAYQTDKRYDDLYAKLPHTTVSSLFTDSKKNIWYGSWDRVLYQFNAIDRKEHVFEQTNEKGSFVNDEVLGFAEDKKGDLWMAGRYNGLHTYNSKNRRFYHYPHNPALEGTVAANRVNCVFIDEGGIIWIGTSKGVSIGKPFQQQFTQSFLPKINDRNIAIYDFYKNGKGDLWVATNNGVYIRKHGEQLFTHRSIVYKGNELLVSRFFKSSKGDYYIGTDYSLFMFNPENFSIQLLPNTEKDGVMKQIYKSNIVSIVEHQVEDKPSIFVAPYGHFIAYYDLNEQRWVSRLDSTKKIIDAFNIADNLIRKIYKTSSGNLWMATAKEGLAEWVTNSSPRLKYHKNNPQIAGGLSNNNVYDMVEDQKGNLWVSTFGGGLNYFNTTSKKATHINASNNLLEGVETDTEGNVWMVGNGNLHKYNITTKTHSTFKLPDVEKIGGIQGRICKDGDGNLYVSGTNYFIEFNPLQIQENNWQPKVFFTDFKIFNQSYSDLLLSEKVSLRHNQNFVSFEFAAPDYSSGNPVHYQYMLQGFDRTWVDNGTETRASFSNLAGGDYVFKVRATNKPGVWSDQFATIRLTIIPPVWKRWWFYAVCALLAAGIGYAVYRYRINELIKRQEIRNKIAQDLHDNVGSTLSSISIYSQVAKIYKKQDKEQQLQETLEKISETSGEMISEMNDIVWAINPRNDHMEVMMQRMESYAKPLLSAKEIQFSFEYDASVKSLNLDMTKRKNFYLIFKESVNNILKYANCKNVQVSVYLRNNQLEMKIKDDGAGFDVEQMKMLAAKSLSGNGLNNMKRRATEIKGECLIESKPGMGTSVVLRFPIP